MKKSDKNSIDKDQVAENPGLLPYAHHVGSAIIRPIDKGKTKGVAMKAMYQQTETQLTQIKDQVEFLIQQAQEIHNRISISERIYQAECSFKPVINQTYYVYSKTNDSWLLSMISPSEWGEKCPYAYIAKADLNADHTWAISEVSEDFKL